MTFRVNSHSAKSGSSARRLVQYLLRRAEYAPKEKDAARTAQEDTQQYGDYVDHRVGNLPAWAREDAQRFFTAAERYEGGGDRRARRWATSWQLALPNELSREEQWAMGTAFVATHLTGHAYV